MIKILLHDLKGMQLGQHPNISKLPENIVHKLMIHKFMYHDIPFVIKPRQGDSGLQRFMQTYIYIYIYQVIISGAFKKSTT